VRSSDVEDLGEGCESDVALLGRMTFLEEAAGAGDFSKVFIYGALVQFHMSRDSWHRPLGLIA
jgi:hypothetical protein